MHPIASPTEPFARSLCRDRLTLAVFICCNLNEFGCNLGLFSPLRPLPRFLLIVTTGSALFHQKIANAQVGPASFCGRPKRELRGVSRNKVAALAITW